MAETLTFNSLWAPAAPVAHRPVQRGLPRNVRPVRPTGTELFEKLEVDEVAQEERNRPSCRTLVPCISPTCLCTMLAVLAIPIALAVWDAGRDPKRNERPPAPAVGVAPAVGASRAGRTTTLPALQPQAVK